MSIVDEYDYEEDGTIDHLLAELDDARDEIDRLRAHVERVEKERAELAQDYWKTREELEHFKGRWTGGFDG